MSLLSSLSRIKLHPNRHELSCILAPPVLSKFCVPTRYAQTYTKGQKKTIAKYAARQAHRPGKAGDFLSSARSQGGGVKKKESKENAAKGKKGKEEAAEGGGKDKTNVMRGAAEEEEGEKEGGVENIGGENLELGLPDFKDTEDNYLNYEEIIPAPEQEEVTSTILDNERVAMIKRLWEPYETEDFNLKKLLGENPERKQVRLVRNEVLQTEEVKKVADDRSPKMLYYSDQELQQYLPEGVAGRVTKEFGRFKRKAVMVRPIVEDIVSWLADWRKRQFIGRFMDRDFYTLLAGPIGCGKSACLNPIVHWARLTGWLVVFVPNGKEWASYGRLSYSKVNETWFGQPELAIKWITALTSVHGDKLAQIPLRTDFTVRDVDPDKSTFTSSPESSLLALLQYGLKYPEQASDCVWYFRQELCSVTEYPVLLAIDGVNIISDHSEYGDPIDPYVFAPFLDTSRLVMNRAFQDFQHHGLINGMYVGTLSTTASLRTVQVRRKNLDLRRTEYHLNPRLALTKIAPLSRPEVHLLSEWYSENGMYTEPPPVQTIDYMWAMSQGNGDLFWKQVQAL